MSFLYNFLCLKNENIPGVCVEFNMFNPIQNLFVECALIKWQHLLSLEIQKIFAFTFLYLHCTSIFSIYITVLRMSYVLLMSFQKTKRSNILLKFSVHEWNDLKHFTFYILHFTYFVLKFYFIDSEIIIRIHDAYL